MTIPNAERAVVELVKLRDYCLSRSHPRGRHKARVFKATLGVTEEDAATVREALLRAVLTEEAQLLDRDEYGTRYVVDFLLEGPSGRATIRSGWIVRAGEDFPRFASCYVLRERGE